MSKSRGNSPRKFAEKIALLNKREAEATAEFEKILKEVKETKPQPNEHWCPPTRSASFSNRLACDQQLRPQLRHQQIIYGQQIPNQYYTQPVQFQPPSNQSFQQRQQVAGDIRHEHHHNHNSLQHHHQEHSQRPTIYVDQLEANYMHHTPTATCNQMQPISIEVPNIEIFSIDDEYQQQQQQQQHHNVHLTSPIPFSGSPSTLTNGLSSNDCSNSSVSSARSLPNIATLCVSPSTNHMVSQPVGAGQRLIPPMSGNHLSSSSAATSLITRNNNDEKYALDPNNDWVNREETCSLPAIRDPMQGASRQAQDRQSQTHIHQLDSWQQVAVSSASSSAAPTPPYGVMVQGSPYGEHSHSPQQQTVYSPDSSPQHHSPQSPNQDYYSLQPIQNHNPIVRASSTNIINEYPNNYNLLEAPQINSNLSKSTEGCYGNRSEFVSNEIFCSRLEDGGAGLDHTVNNLDQQYITTPNHIARSCSEKNIDPRNQSQNQW